MIFFIYYIHGFFVLFCTVVIDNINLYEVIMDGTSCSVRKGNQNELFKNQ